MNLTSTIISIGIATSLSIYFLQNQQHHPEEINYRAALQQLEVAAQQLSEQAEFPIHSSEWSTQCKKIDSTFTQKLPLNSRWELNIQGLDCDIALLSISADTQDDFRGLINAAKNSSIAQDSKANHDKKQLQWTYRLYHRDTIELGIESKLKPTNLASCLQCSEDVNKTINGGWSEWSNWGACTTLCDAENKRTRYRTCTNPSPANGGKQCTSDGTKNIEEQLCPNYPCAKWTNWSPWSSCDKTCGEGQQKRTRECRNYNSDLRFDCDRSEKGTEDSRICKIKECPIHGIWSNWSPSPCTKSCGDESQTRSCDNPAPQHNGNFCSREDGSLTTAANITETRSCNLPICPSWSDWSEWSACDAGCQERGVEKSQRTCNNAGNGVTCEGDQIKRRSCTGLCGAWVNVNTCPTQSICLNPGEKDLIKRTCPEGGNNCLLDNGEQFLSGYSEYCGVPRCGRWGESRCTKTCLNPGENDQIKTLWCIGSRCKRNGRYYNWGDTTTESCNTPKCP